MVKFTEKEWLEICSEEFRMYDSWSHLLQTIAATLLSCSISIFVAVYIVFNEINIQSSLGFSLKNVQLKPISNLLSIFIVVGLSALFLSFVSSLFSKKKMKIRKLYLDIIDGSIIGTTEEEKHKMIYQRFTEIEEKKKEKKILE